MSGKIILRIMKIILLIMKTFLRIMKTILRIVVFEKGFPASAPQIDVQAAPMIWLCGTRGERFAQRTYS